MANGRLSVTAATAKEIRKHSFGHAQRVPAAPDGGWGWVVCFACFLVHVFIDGLGYSFGILFVELLNDFQHSKITTSWIPSLATALTSLSGIIVAPFTNRYGCRPVAVVGALLTFTGLFLSHFAPNLYFLYFSYGILTGLGYGLLYFPSIVCVSIYFDKHRAFATGLAVCGAGVGMLIFSPLTHFLIRLYGWRGAILIQAALVLNCLPCALVYHPVDEHEAKITQRCHERQQPKGSISGEIIVDRDTRIVRDHRCVDNEGFIPELDIGKLFEQQGSEGAKFTHKFTPNGNAQHQMCIQGEIIDGTDDATGPFKTVNIQKQRLRSFRSDIDSNGQPGVNANDKIIENTEISSTNGIESYKSYPAKNMDATTKDEGKMFDSRTHNQPEVDGNCFDTCIGGPEIGGTKDTESVWMLIKNSIVGTFNVKILKNQVFCMVVASMFLYSVGFYIPYIYLPDRAKDAGIDELGRAWLLASIGITNTVSRVVFGFIADRDWANRMVLYSTSMVICGLGTALIHFLESFDALLMYSMVFGAFGGVTVALLSVILADVVGIGQLTEAFGVTNFAAGIAILLGPPFAGWLYDLTGGSYDTSFIFGGSCVTVAGLMLYFVPCVDRGRK